MLLRHASPDTEQAPEFRYLTSWVDLQAKKAFGEDGDDDRVLLLANDRLLVGAATLRALAAALDDGADAAVPRRLSETPHLARQPVHTLAGFERLEASALSDPPEEGADGPPAPSPLALLTSEAWQRLGRPAPEALPKELPAGFEVARRGLYHEFIDYYGEVRTDVLSLVPEDGRRILEVGCGRGVTGERLKADLGATVVGVELNPVVAREAATRLDRVITGDVETLDLETDFDEPFDLVLALELFEHLATPERFLETARRLLRPGGTILLSTPNVGHYSVVLDLLEGRWDYLPVGLLCYTHLRFFTARTLDDWLRRLGFDDFDLIPQVTEEAPEIEAVRRALAGRREIDRASLRTKGFYVRIRTPGEASVE